MEFLFWLSVLFVTYPYLGYPLVLVLLRLFHHRPVRRAPNTPPVTLLITAYNERDNILAKLENTVALDYPHDRLQIIVASDCSDDGTDEIVRSFADPRVELVSMPTRRGKEATQNAVLPRVQGEIVIFSDARIQLNRDALRAMMADFADPSIGCVSSVDRALCRSSNDGARPGDAGEGIYLRYEMWLRDLESTTGTLIGASGSLFALRRSLVGICDERMTSDFMGPLRAIAAGFRTVTEPGAIGSYHALQDSTAEFHRKVRTVINGMMVLARMRGLLLPWRRPGAALRLWGHKVLRWTVPFFLATLLLASVALAPTSRFYAAALAGQLAFGTLALAGLIFPRLAALQPIRIPLFFASVNLSILWAWLECIRGRRPVSWQPTSAIDAQRAMMPPAEDEERRSA